MIRSGVASPGKNHFLRAPSKINKKKYTQIERLRTHTGSDQVSFTGLMIG